MISTYFRRKLICLQYKISRFLSKPSVLSIKESERRVLDRMEFFFFNAYKKDGEDLLEAKKRFFASQKPNSNVKKIQDDNIGLLKQFISLCKDNNLIYFLSYGSALGAVRHSGFIPWDDDLDVSMPREDFLKLAEIIKTGNRYKIDESSCPRTESKVYKFKYIETVEARPNVDIFIYDAVKLDTKDAIALRNKYIKKSWIKTSINLRVRLLFKRKDIKSNKGILRTAKYEKYYSLLDKNNLAYRKKLFKKSDANLTQKIVYDITQTDNCCVIGSPSKVYDYDVIFPLKTSMFCGLNVYIPNNYDSYLKSIYGDYYSLPATFSNHLKI